MFGLEYFGFRALWSPYLLIFLAAVTVGYFILIGSQRHRFRESSPVSLKQKWYFMISICLFYLAFGAPLDLLGHLMFSAHMLSMAIGYLVAPPIMLLGLPAWLLRPLFQDKAFRGVMRLLTHPIAALVLFNALFSMYHMPDMHDRIMMNYTLHTVYYIALLLTSFGMWWNMICPIPEMDRLSEVQKMGFIFANGVLLTPACALIIFADHSLYATYTDPDSWAKALGYCVPESASEILSKFKGPQFFSSMSAVEDQQLGGVMMKLIQEIMYASILAAVFFRWRQSAKNNAIDPLPDGV